MGKWLHRKEEASSVRGCCVVCKTNQQTSNGMGKYKPTCNKCRKRRYKYAYRRVKKTACEACGFQAVDTTQLDVDHKDGNHHNNDPNNLWTLCANCHRLKTWAPEKFGAPFFLVPVRRTFDFLLLAFTGHLIVLL